MGLPVKVTLWIRGRGDVPAEQVSDKRVSKALVQMGKDLGTKLEHVRCPTHGQGPTNVRIQVGASGEGDLRYESCCEALVSAVGQASS